MLNIKTILLPVDFPQVSLPVIHQAATLARHFRSEIVILHVVTAKSHASGVPYAGAESAGWNLLSEILKVAESNLDRTLRPELDGLVIRQSLVEGEPAQEIMEMAQLEKADLIMMPSYGYTFDQFLLGSVTAKVLRGTNAPVWTGAHVEASSAQNFTIRNVLCAVDFRSHNRVTVSWASQFAADFAARLTLAHVTPSVEFWGPGGNSVNPEWKADLVDSASQHMADLQREMGTKAEVFIGSGDVPKVLCQAARETQADLLVTGCQPYGGHLRTHGYSIISAVPVPVLSV